MKCEHSAATIVLLGRFQPDDFMPNRLVEKKIISSKDGAAAQFLTLIGGQAVQYKLPWATLLVANDRFQVSTSDMPFVRISDLARKAIGELDTHAVITAMGLNFDAHYDVGGFSDRDRIACRLAPPEAWGNWGQAIKESMQTTGPEGMEMHGGLMSQTMRLPLRLGSGLRGWRDVTIEPSNVIPDAKGIWLRTNLHHALDTPDEEKTDDKIFDNEEILERFLCRLDEAFDTAIIEAEEIFKGVIGL